MTYFRILDCLVESGIGFRIAFTSNQVVQEILDVEGRPIVSTLVPQVDICWLQEQAYLIFPKSDFASEYASWARIYLRAEDLARLGISEGA